MDLEVLKMGEDSLVYCPVMLSDISSAEPTDSVNIMLTGW
jgi:hypothetical protein